VSFSLTDLFAKFPDVKTCNDHLVSCLKIVKRKKKWSVYVPQSYLIMWFLLTGYTSVVSFISLYLVGIVEKVESWSKSDKLKKRKELGRDGDRRMARER